MEMRLLHRLTFFFFFFLSRSRALMEGKEMRRRSLYNEISSRRRRRRRAKMYTHTHTRKNPLDKPLPGSIREALLISVTFVFPPEGQHILLVYFVFFFFFCCCLALLPPIFFLLLPAGAWLCFSILLMGVPLVGRKTATTRTSRGASVILSLSPLRVDLM